MKSSCKLTAAVFLMFFCSCLKEKKEQKVVQPETATTLKTQNNASQMASAQMVKAIKEDDVLIVEKLLAAGENPNGLCIGYTRGERNGEKNQSDKDWTLLMLATHHHKIEIIKLLLENKANINAVNAVGLSALFLACASSYEDVAFLLLKNNADIKKAGYDPSGQSALQWAFSYELDKLAMELIDRGADLNTFSTETGRSVLLEALYGDKIQSATILKLIDFGANVDFVTANEKETPLMFACRKDDLAVVKKIVEKTKKSINAETNTGNTALSYAAGNNGKGVKMLQFLIDNRAKVNLANGKGRNALLEAVGSQSLEKVQFLVENGAIVNRKTEEYGEVSPLHEAVFNVDFNMTKYLISKGADVNAKSSRGETVLLRSVFNENSKPIIALLIDSGAIVNMKNDDRQTPLMIAARNNLYEICKLLIASGAEKEGVDFYRKTAKIYAEETAERTGENQVLTLFK